MLRSRAPAPDESCLGTAPGGCPDRVQRLVKAGPRTPTCQTATSILLVSVTPEWYIADGASADMRGARR